MIDLEAKASTRLPLLYEVAQLIEDQGLLSCDDDGWKRREEIVRDYIGELHKLVPTIGKASKETGMVPYAVFALVRAVANLPAIGRRNIGRTSESSVVRAREHRANHYLELIQSIHERFSGQPLGDAATLIADSIRRHEEALRDAASRVADEALPQPTLPPVI